MAILYAIYTLKEQNIWNRERVFAFASIERFIANSGGYQRHN